MEKITAKKTAKAGEMKKLTVVIIVLSVLLAIILAAIAAVWIIFDFGLQEEPIPPEPQTGFIDDNQGHTDDTDDDNTAGVNTLNNLRDSDTLSTALKGWAVSDESSAVMSSKNVLNFLLIGVDESGCNSDVIMILSLNKSTQKIYLTSVMRDCYTYIDTIYGDRYAKINAAYANGGAQCLINTIQNDFKIKIDHYVLVNFKSFTEIVETLGGVTVTVQPYEAAEIGLGCPSGENVTLNGIQALSFCRIRYCDADGDVSRTRRQRQFITSIINRTKEVSFAQVSDVVNTLLKYVKTDLTTTNLVSIASQAILGKWNSFEIIQQTMPLPEYRMDYMGYAWVWIVDYPGAAQYMQNTIYGKTNIVLADDRVTAMDIVINGNTGEANP